MEADVVFEQRAWQFFKKSEDACFFPLVFAEGFVVHEEVECVSFLFRGKECEFVGGERIVFGFFVSESERNVIGEFVVA
mgnify:CR=1 FL=1